MTYYLRFIVFLGMVDYCMASTSSHTSQNNHAQKENVGLPFSIHEISSHIWYVPTKGRDYLTFKICFRHGGFKSEPDEKFGVGDFVCELIQEGCDKLSSQEFKEFLLEHNIQMNVSIDVDHFYITVRCLNDNAVHAFDIIKKMILSATIAKKEFEKVRAQIKGSYAQKQHDENNVAQDFFSSLIYGHHPYGKTTNDVLQKIDHITQNDVRAFLERMIGGDNLCVIGCGGLDTKLFEKLVKDFESALPKHNNLPKTDDALISLKDHIYFKEMDIPHSIIITYLPGIKISDPNYYAASLVNSAFGGAAFVSRLWMSVREKKGYAYSVGSRINNPAHASLFIVKTSVETKNVQKVIDIIRAEIKTLKEKGLTQEEINYHKDTLTGRQSVTLDSTGAICDYLLSVKLCGLGPQDAREYKEKILSLTQDTITQTTKRMFHTEPKFCVIGRKTDKELH